MFEPDDLLLALTGAQVEFIVIAGSRSTPMCSLKHLLAMKRVAGRVQALEDIRHLEGATQQ